MVSRMWTASKMHHNLQNYLMCVYWDY